MISLLIYFLQSWFSEGMTVLRKSKGRRWCIIYAGSEEGWAGEPWVWEADNRSADYHENMNANMFESYMVALCKWCAAKYPHRKVVFCMDNAKYHRSEYQANPANEAAIGNESVKTVDEYLTQKTNARKGKLPNAPPQKSLSQLKKDELIQRLAPLLGVKFAPLREETFAHQMKGYKKNILYDLARKPEFALPLTTEVIAQR